MFQNTHMEYVVAAATLYGQIFGINGTRESVRKILATADVPLFTPKSSVKIHLTDKEMQEDKEKESGDAGDFFFNFTIIYLLLSKRIPRCV